MAGRLQRKGVLTADGAAGEVRYGSPVALAGLGRHWGALRGMVANRFRRWREDRQTVDALRHLDDRQLSEFGIHRRTPDLSGRKFP